MRVIIKIFVFWSIFCNIPLFSGTCVYFPKDKVSFSKKVLTSGIIRAKAQLLLTYSYLRNQLWANLDLGGVAKKDINERVEIQAAFHKARNQYKDSARNQFKDLLNDLNQIQEFVGGKAENIKFICFEVLVKSLFFVYERFSSQNGLNISFNDFKILREDTWKIIQSDKDNLYISFQDYCTMIGELLDLNDKLIKQKVDLPPQEFLAELDKKNPEPAFKPVFSEELQKKQLELHKDYLSVVF
jgi:hypothetical protein